MRVGVLAKGDIAELNWAKELGFRSIEWVGFAESTSGPKQEQWQESADKVAAEARSRDIRISAIGALYANPLDPQQTEFARGVFRRAIEVAERIGVRTVAGFAGSVIDVEINPRGGNPVCKPAEQSLPALLEFWEPLAALAQDKGVRIAFENCPQGAFHLPIMHYNALSQPAMWERFFDATRYQNLGLEWDPSHLLCQLIDPVATIRKFGSRIFHVHAKDAYINPDLLRSYGICHPGVSEHRMPGLGQANWAEIVHCLVRVGYDSDLNIEGWHDPVFRNHAADSLLAGRRLEDAGLQIARRTLDQFTSGIETESNRCRDGSSLR
jgi:sugar phosphate isomerase/epimerase